MSLKNVYVALEEIANEPSTNAKQSLIQKYLDIPYFKEVAYFAYNPFLKYKISDVPAAKFDSSRSAADIFSILKHLSTQRGANNQDRDALSRISSIDSETISVVNRILKSDLRCGAGITLFRKFIPEIPVHEPMLCGKEFDKFMKVAGSYDNVATSIKQDGVRVWAIVIGENVRYISRNGKEFPNFDVFNEHLISAVKEMNLSEIQVIFDGEVITKDKDFQKVLTQFRRLTEATKDIFEFRIFDIVLDKPFTERYELLKEYFVEDYEVNRPIVNLVYHSRHLNSKEGIFKLLDQVIDEGEEGLVVKTLNGPYEFKRSNHWCKLKRFYTEDLPVIGMEYGTGKYKDRLGALICDFNGVKVSVGSGYDDYERTELMLNIPSMIEVKYQSVTKDGSLRFPVFMRVREDK